MEGRVIARAQVNRPDLRWPLPERMADRLTGQRGLSLRRRSKYILADLSSGESLLIHLGMSGRMLVSGGMLGAFHHDHPAPEKHDHVVLDMEGGGARHLQRRPPLRRDGSDDRPPVQRRIRCWPAWGRSRWATASTSLSCRPR
jgi:formamidopyrimidine-DNA glycosylase